MKNITSILLLIAILFTVSCKKIEPPIDPSQANDPIYQLEGLINGDSLNLYVNDTTVFISNAPHNMNGIEAYSSTISDIESGFELKLIVLKPELYVSEEGIQSIENTNTSYIVHRPTCMSFDFSNGSNQENYTKVVANGTTFYGNEIELEEYGKYDIGFNFNNINSQIYTIPVKVGFKDEILNPIFTIENCYSKILLKSENLNITNNWLLDGDLISTNLIDSITVSNGIHSITHEVTDENNNSASYTTLINYYNDLIWQISPDYCSDNVVENNYSHIIIEVMKNGEKYTSAYNTENLSKEFDITTIEYILDPITQSINFIKLKVNFDVELKTIDNSKTLNLTDMEGTFHIKIN